MSNLSGLFTIYFLVSQTSLLATEIGSSTSSLIHQNPKSTHELVDTTFGKVRVKPAKKEIYPIDAHLKNSIDSVMQEYFETKKILDEELDRNVMNTNIANDFVDDIPEGYKKEKETINKKLDELHEKLRIDLQEKIDSAFNSPVDIETKELEFADFAHFNLFKPGIDTEKNLLKNEKGKFRKLTKKEKENLASGIIAIRSEIDPRYYYQFKINVNIFRNLKEIKKQFIADFSPTVFTLNIDLPQTILGDGRFTFKSALKRITHGVSEFLHPLVGLKTELPKYTFEDILENIEIEVYKHVIKNMDMVSEQNVFQFIIPETGQNIDFSLYNENYRAKISYRLRSITNKFYKIWNREKHEKRAELLKTLKQLNVPKDEIANELNEKMSLKKQEMFYDFLEKNSEYLENNSFDEEIDSYLKYLQLQQPSKFEDPDWRESQVTKYIKELKEKSTPIPHGITKLIIERFKAIKIILGKYAQFDKDALTYIESHMELLKENHPIKFENPEWREREVNKYVNTLERSHAQSISNAIVKELRENELHQEALLYERHVEANNKYNEEYYRTKNKKPYVYTFVKKRILDEISKEDLIKPVLNSDSNSKDKWAYRMDYKKTRVRTDQNFWRLKYFKELAKTNEYNLKQFITYQLTQGPTGLKTLYSTTDFEYAPKHDPKTGKIVYDEGKKRETFWSYYSRLKENVETAFDEHRGEYDLVEKGHKARYWTKKYVGVNAKALFSLQFLRFLGDIATTSFWTSAYLIHNAPDSLPLLKSLVNLPGVRILKPSSILSIASSLGYMTYNALIFDHFRLDHSMGFKPPSAINTRIFPLLTNGIGNIILGTGELAGSFIRLLSLATSLTYDTGKATIKSSYYLMNDLLYQMTKYKIRNTKSLKGKNFNLTSGPGVNGEYLYQINKETAIAMVYLRLLQDEYLTQLSNANRLSDILEDIPNSIREKIIQDSKSPIELKIENLKTLTQNEELTELYKRARMKEDELISTLKYTQTLLVAFHEQYIYPRLEKENISIEKYWKSKGLVKDDWQSLAKSLLKKGFSPYILQPNDDIKVIQPIFNDNTFTEIFRKASKFIDNNLINKFFADIDFKENRLPRRNNISNSIPDLDHHPKGMLDGFYTEKDLMDEFINLSKDDCKKSVSALI